jgi:hypothetical protein
MNASTEIIPPMIRRIPAPSAEPSCKNGERIAGATSPNKLTSKLAISKFLATIELQDNTIDTNATSTNAALTSNMRSATSEVAAVASGTNLAYMMSIKAMPKETAVAQAYKPTASGPGKPVDSLRGLFVLLISVYADLSAGRVYHTLVIRHDEAHVDGVAHQSGHVIDVQPLHQLRPVRLDCFHAHLERIGHLLRGSPLGN